jgi:oxalate decarboxylase
MADDDILGWLALGGVAIGALYFLGPSLSSAITGGGMGGRSIGVTIGGGNGGGGGNCLVTPSPGRIGINLAGSSPVFSSGGATERIVTGLSSPPSPALVKNWPVSAGLLQLSPGASRGYITHSNADKVFYCFAGTNVVTLFSNTVSESFTMTPGDMAFIPKGFIYSIRNTGSVSSGFVEGWDATTVQTLPIAAPRAPPARVSGTSKFKVNLETATPDFNSPGGSDTAGNSTRLLVLRGLALFSIHLKPNGVREPHNHPNASELHYVLSGQSGYQVMNPSTGAIDQGSLGPGSFFVAPPGYLHWFWNTGGNSDLHLIAIFTNELPGDKGYTAAYQVISKRAAAGCPMLSDYVR